VTLFYLPTLQRSGGGIDDSTRTDNGIFFRFPYRFLSPDGRCYSFDERANGYSRGEGVGCVFLKPLEDAIRDGDPIRAVIRNTGSNQDGKTPGITLPSREAQEDLIRSVYAKARMDPLDTCFVECHGTGTPAGDPLETEALANVFTKGRSPEKPLLIGSVKTNVFTAPTCFASLMT